MHQSLELEIFHPITKDADILTEIWKTRLKGLKARTGFCQCDTLINFLVAKSPQHSHQPEPLVETPPPLSNTPKFRVSSWRSLPAPLLAVAMRLEAWYHSDGAGTRIAAAANYSNLHLCFCSWINFSEGPFKYLLLNKITEWYLLVGRFSRLQIRVLIGPGKLTAPSVSTFSSTVHFRSSPPPQWISRRCVSALSKPLTSAPKISADNREFSPPQTKTPISTLNRKDDSHSLVYWLWLIVRVI